MTEQRIMGAVVAAAITAFTVAGCGGSESTSPLTGPGPQIKVTRANEKIVDFGSEASAPDREAAAKVLRVNLEAREAADFSTQCSTLGLVTLEEVVGSRKQSPLRKCPAALEKLAEPLAGSAKSRRNTLGQAGVTMRIKGKDGYVLYHGTDGKDYAMPMTDEDGQWKVDGLVAIEV
jgi:hypothetical protein